MRISTTIFEDSAGKIWNALSENDYLHKKKLLKITKLNEKELYAGLGWLAREDKVYKDNNEYYKLDKTNLTYDIGALAGRIWKILDIWDEADIYSIKKLSEANEKDIYSAIGWLAREDKICENGEQIYSLK